MQICDQLEKQLNGCMSSGTFKNLAESEEKKRRTEIL